VYKPSYLPAPDLVQKELAPCSVFSLAGCRASSGLSSTALDRRLTNYNMFVPVPCNNSYVKHKCCAKLSKWNCVGQVPIENREQDLVGGAVYTMSLHVEVEYMTHRGKVRSNNEDALLIMSDVIQKKKWLILKG